MTTNSPLAATLQRIERASGSLATQSVALMDEQLAWFRAMPPDQRSWITVVAQAGIASFVNWLRHTGTKPSPIGDVFGTAPPELARAVSLQQTVELVRITVEVVEYGVEHLAAPGEEAALREAVLRYSREVAFAAAEVYAGVAESRGAWDARLEAMVVDALLSGEPDDTMPSRAAALGWATVSEVLVIVGTAPAGDPQTVLDAIQRSVRPARTPALAGVHGDRLLVVLGSAGGTGDSRTNGGDHASPGSAANTARTVVAPLLAEFGDGPVVIGPTVPNLAQASRSAAAALTGLRAAPGWPGAPRPVHAAELLPERALAGDEDARRELVAEIYTPLVEAPGPLLETVAGYLERGGALEATARDLYVHPNTVRYRLRRVADLTGRSPTEPRDAFVVRTALVLGRLTEPSVTAPKT
ncbi:MAG TPA: helix-turn-helix domain-containing protein [Mycobacteriales bacterium]|nr:helix-turn-helix domain-containing protein [Mycobacteriales bacterium]